MNAVDESSTQQKICNATATKQLKRVQLRQFISFGYIFKTTYNIGAHIH